MTRGTRGATGSGPGAIAPDGSPVDFYLRLPAGRDPNLIHGAIPDGCAILELGCGVGRMTRRLVELGHPVVAVDQSPEMLAHVRGAETVLADIESLDLGRSFPAVVLASFLVNVADEDTRRAYLRACARHVDGGGLVLIQRIDPAWRVEPGTSATGIRGIARIRTRILERQGTIAHAVAEYSIDGERWEQDYWCELLDDEAITGALQHAGLEVAGWLKRPTWLAAQAIRPSSAPGSTKPSGAESSTSRRHPR